MLWIRMDPELFAGFGSGIIYFGSGYDKFQFSETKNAMKSAEHLLVRTVNLTVRSKNFTGYLPRLPKSVLKLKFLLQLCFKRLLLPPHCKLGRIQNFLKKSDPDPKNNFGSTHKICMTLFLMTLTPRHS